MGSRGISCMSVFMKTLTEWFSLFLSACLLPYFVFFPLTAVLICCGSGASTGPCFAVWIPSSRKQPLEGPWPHWAAGSHKCAGFPRFWFPTWLEAVGVELSELSSWSEGLVHWPQRWDQLWHLTPGQLCSGACAEKSDLVHLDLALGSV